jgi:hypothetical protein
MAYWGNERVKKRGHPMEKRSPMNKCYCNCSASRRFSRFIDAKLPFLATCPVGGFPLCRGPLGAPGGLAE